jgi:copper resistance protein D
VRVAYLVSVWLHLLAVITWVGGMAFLVTVVVPWLRKGDRAQAAALLRDTGRRFRTVGWVCFAIIAVTGTYNLWARGVRLGSFLDAGWRGSPFGQAVLVKLGLFAVVLVVSAIHDFSVGPRASDELVRAPGSPRAERLRRAASLMGRGNALLAIALVAVGVILVRGWPW